MISYYYVKYSLFIPLEYHFQHDLQAHSYICSILAQINKFHRGRNWPLEFATIHEQPSYFLIVVELVTSNFDVVFQNWLLHSCCFHIPCWCAGLTSALIIIYVYLDKPT